MYIYYCKFSNMINIIYFKNLSIIINLNLTNSIVNLYYIDIY